MIQLQRPYLLFLGDAPDQLAAKTAAGIGQLRLPDCRADLKLPDKTLDEARAASSQPKEETKSHVSRLFQ
jgi:hypothetical protein